jgi:gas vesicle protein
MDGRVKVAVGVLSGAALGAAAGLLLAPRSGAAMRRDLRRAADRIGRRAIRLYEDSSDAIKDWALDGARAIDRASEVADRIAAQVGR